MFKVCFQPLKNKAQDILDVRQDNAIPGFQLMVQSYGAPGEMSYLLYF